MTDLLDWAHGIGGQKDLPISLGLAVSGGVAALVISFTVLAVAWRRPRYFGTEGRPVPRLQAFVDHPATVVVMRVVGMAFFVFAVVTATFGRESYINPFIGLFYVWLWVGLVPFSLLLGRFYRAISPVRTINLGLAKLTGGDPERGLYPYPERLGLWPAALGLFAFVWLELVYQFMSDLGPIRLWCAVYVAIMLIGGALFGDSFYEHCDPFEVYSSLVARMSVWGRVEGRLVVRSPLANLASIAPTAGLIGVIGVLFGSTGFDSFGESPQWIRFVQGSDLNGNLLKNAALIGFCLAAMAILALGSMATGIGDDLRRRELPNAFAASIVPIVVGYVFAHYLTFFVELGTRNLGYASDPFSTGADYLGLRDLPEVSFFSYHPTLLATIKVLAVVLGHVVAAVVAHDRAIHLLPKRHQLTGQLPLLAAMVGFTAGGLYFLFAA